MRLSKGLKTYLDTTSHLLRNGWGRKFLRTFYSYLCLLDGALCLSISVHQTQNLLIQTLGSREGTRSFLPLYHNCFPILIFSNWNPFLYAGNLMNCFEMYLLSSVQFHVPLMKGMRPYRLEERCVLVSQWDLAAPFGQSLTWHPLMCLLRQSFPKLK